jgi:hypothetical protein
VLNDHKKLNMQKAPQIAAFRHIKGKHNLIYDAVPRLDLDDSSEESK